MSNLIERTEVQSKSNRFERISGKVPKKVRFSELTALSLMNNVSNDLIDIAIKKYNDRYEEIHNAVVVAEKEKAEEIERNKVLEDESKVKAIEGQLEQENMLAKKTSVENIIAITKNNSLELLKLKGRIGTYKDKYAINVQKGFNNKKPKAISVQRTLTDVCKVIMSKIDYYKLKEKEKVETTKVEEKKVVEKQVPNWKKLFEGVKPTTSGVTVALQKNKELEEDVVDVVTNNKISEEELSYRKMLGQLGDEFQVIEDYEKSKNGVPLQFKEGFESRKNNLLNIFRELTGINVNKKENIEIKKENTEFQNMIDDINGYKEPMSEEEHKKMEESLNEYYSSEEVSSKINELKEKDVLFTFNQHMNDVIKNERIQNNLDASKTVEESNEKIDRVEEQVEEKNELDDLKKGAEEQARMLKTLYDYIDKRDKFEEERRIREQKEREENESQKKEIMDGAYEQARLLNFNNIILSSAEKEAQRIYNEQKEQDRQMILEGAKEEAERLNDNNIILDSAEKEARRIISEQVEIKRQATEEERKRSEQEQKRDRQMILEGAKEEAQRLNDNNIILDSAEKEARRIIDEQQQDENKEILESASEEAQRLNDNNIILDSAEKEAQRIYNEQKEQDRQMILEGAKEEAERINTQNLIYKGAQEQAQMLQNENEHIDLINSAEVQAKILFNKNRKIDLLEEKEILSQKLKSINEEESKLNDLLGIEEREEKNEVVPTNDSEFDTEIIASAEEEAKRIVKKQQEETQRIAIEEEKIRSEQEQDRHMILEGAKEEAIRLNNNNIILDSAKEEAKKLYSKQKEEEYEMILEGAKEEANRLNENNIILDSAEKEAMRIVKDQEIIRQSAEEEAKRIYKENKKSNVVDSNIVIFDSISRYAELTSKSNALLVKESRINTLRKRQNDNLSKSYEDKKKEMLMSLKEEIDKENYSFLQKNENDLLDNNMAIKAA